MLGELNVHGIVLSSMPVGEYDRRITILTLERGRISAFAKGARRPTGAFLACSRPFTYATFTLYEGRESYNVKTVEKPHYFEELSGDLEGMYYGMYFCELAGVLTGEGADESMQMKLLYVSLLALTKDVLPRRLVRCVFEIRIIAQYGEAMRAEGPFYLRKANGLIDGNVAGARRVSDSTLYTVRHILHESIKELYNFTVSDDVLGELEFLAGDWLDSHVDRKLKSREILEEVLSSEALSPGSNDNRSGD